MVETQKKKLVIVIRQTPYGSSLARAGIDAALATAAFDQPVELLFMGNGVLQLLPEQGSEALGLKNLGKLLGSLPLYDIETVNVDATAIERFHLNPAELILPVTLLDGPAIHALLSQADHLMGF